LGTGHVGEVDVDLVDAPVFDLWCQAPHGGLEQARVPAVFVEVHWQQHRLGCELRGLHDAHARVGTQGPRLVGGGGDHAAAGIVGQARKATRAVGRPHRRMGSASANDHRLPAKLGIAQEFHRRVERVHVEMGDEA
jgi:hypothetical protein